MSGPLQRIATMSLWASVLSLLATVAAGLWLGASVALPLLGLTLCLVAVWAGLERGLEAVLTSRSSSHVRGGGEVTVHGRTARFSGYANMAGAVVLFVLGALILVHGALGRLGPSPQEEPEPEPVPAPEPVAGEGVQRVEHPVAREPPPDPEPAVQVKQPEVVDSAAWLKEPLPAPWYEGWPEDLQPEPFERHAREAVEACGFDWVAVSCERAPCYAVFSVPREGRGDWGVLEAMEEDCPEWTERYGELIADRSVRGSYPRTCDGEEQWLFVLTSERALDHLGIETQAQIDAQKLVEEERTWRFRGSQACP